MQNKKETITIHDGSTLGSAAVYQRMAAGYRNFGAEKVEKFVD